jgi:hypothetical protein
MFWWQTCEPLQSVDDEGKNAWRLTSTPLDVKLTVPLRAKSLSDQRKNFCPFFVRVFLQTDRPK